MTKSSQWSGLLGIGFIALCGLAALIFLVIPEFRLAHRLLSEGKPITAQITDLTPVRGRARQAKYVYTVDGHDFKGKCVVPESSNSFGPIAVIYLPGHPGFSDSNPQKRSSDATFALVIFCLFECVLIGVFGMLCYSFRGSNGSSV